MSNPFYKYVSQQIKTYLSEEAVRGEVNRYFLYLPDQTYTDNVYEALKTDQLFTYQHEEGAVEYRTFYLEYSGMRYVVAKTSDHVTIDFLVTLRNKVSEQSEEFKNTSILFLTHAINDSIHGGSKDLTHEGFPLHVKNFIGSLNELMEGSGLTQVEKVFLKEYLSKRGNEYKLDNASFLDFEHVLNVINSGNLEPKDYASLEFFQDQMIEKMIEESDGRITKKIKRRLEDNSKQFEEIERFRLLGNGKERLEEEYDKGANELMKDEWYELEFEKVDRWKEKVQEKKKIQFYSEEVQVETKIKGIELDYWARFKSDTAAGRRNWSFIIAHPHDNDDEIQIKLPFSNRVRDSFLTNKASQKSTKISGKNLIVTVSKEREEVTFLRVTYKHEDVTSGKFDFNIMVVPSTLVYLEPVRNDFFVKPTPVKSQALQLPLTGSKLRLSNNTHPDTRLISEENQIISGENGIEVEFDTSVIDDKSQLRFIVDTGGYDLPIEVRDETLKITPRNAFQLWEEKRIQKTSIKTEEQSSRAYVNNRPYSTFSEERVFYELEYQWLEENVRYAKLSQSELIAESLVLPENVSKAYEEVLEEFKERGTIPSLTYLDEELVVKIECFIDLFNQAVENIDDRQSMYEEQRNLFRLGTLESTDKIYYTPFSPLNLAYQLELNRLTSNEKIDRNILQQLKTNESMPYIYSESDKLFKLSTNNKLPEWTLYLPSEKVSVSRANTFLDKVVQEKLEQFNSYNDYYFNLTSETPYLINIIKINNDLEILKGLIQWLKKEIRKNNGFDDLRRVEVKAYENSIQGLSAFEQFNNVKTPLEAEALLGIKLGFENFHPEDVLLEIQKVLRYSRVEVGNEITYAHISFYKMDGEENPIERPMNSAPSSLNLNGIVTSIVSEESERSGYQLGFSIGESEKNRSQLTQFIINMNELAANMRNNGANSYVKGNSIALQVTAEEEEFLSDVYKESHWITFIDPLVDLEYFQSTSDNLVIVHYSDQLTPGSHFDAITVTDKSDQYANVIKDFLNAQKVEIDENQIYSIVKSFNTFNGEWLLRAVQGKMHDRREKMSVVSAIKHTLVYFSELNPDVVWVPISMEEIVRVTGNIGLRRSEGIFSGKTIGEKGNCSDDLLMIGVSSDEENKVYFYPVEVKIGHNQSNVISKGIEQVKELRARLNKNLQGESFDAKFLRNFFMKLFIQNAHDMSINEFWPEKNYELSQVLIDKLLNDEFIISDELDVNYGQGLVVSYKKDARMYHTERRQGVIINEFPEQQGYDTLALPMNQVKLKVDYPPLEVNVEESVSRSYSEIPTSQHFVINPDGTVDKTKKEVSVVEPKKVPRLTEREKENVSTELLSGTELERVVEEVNNYGITEQESVRALIGNAKNGAVYWDFNNPKLSNRHLVIGGRSGQGKTYFIQSLLLDLARSGQSAVVIDYSSSFSMPQLESYFKDELSDKLKERIVYHEGFPINPFKRREKEVSGKTFIERPAESAGRIADVFTAVYSNFGHQQRSALYNALKKGIEKYDNGMKMEHLLDEITLLDDVSSTVTSTILNRLQQFVDIDPFDYESENEWEKAFAGDGQITVIQLDGFDQREMKNLMTEFILWDLWYFSQDGVKERALPVILDEAQNLDFSPKSPAYKILREGRKFGWSAWFATQSFSDFTKEEMTTIENAATKVYFSPADSEIRPLSNQLGVVSEDEFRSIGKGECIVLGEFISSNQLIKDETHHIVKVPSMEER